MKERNKTRTAMRDMPSATAQRRRKELPAAENPQ